MDNNEKNDKIEQTYEALRLLGKSRASIYRAFY